MKFGKISCASKKTAVLRPCRCGTRQVSLVSLSLTNYISLADLAGLAGFTSLARLTSLGSLGSLASHASLASKLNFSIKDLFDIH